MSRYISGCSIPLLSASLSILNVSTTHLPALIWGDGAGTVRGCSICCCLCVEGCGHLTKDGEACFLIGGVVRCCGEVCRGEYFY